MKIALLGYGKMGKAIEKIANNRAHQIVLKVGKNTQNFDLQTADVAIDFSTPTAAKNNILNCIAQGLPVVSGTTGWLQHYDQVVAYCLDKGASFIYSSNFSLGVNLFFELNAKLATIMQRTDTYEVAIEETHHTQKRDTPSGTAITLAEQIVANSKLSHWELASKEKPSADTLPIYANRVSNVPGTHQITYTSAIDTIAIQHTAHNRQGFALGAVVAAEWLRNKKGVFTMKDVLDL